MKDTIVSQATAIGKGGIGILRVSGNEVKNVANALLGKIPLPRYAEYLPFMDEHQYVLDQGIALYFPAPNSFTGEDVLELHAHGGPVVLDMLLNRILLLPNIRIARPGEFSERAFLNDKLDLAQAEAIADLIDASSQQAVRSATRALQGMFSVQIHQLVDALIQLRTYVEAAIDFPDEEIDFLSDGKIDAQLTQIMEQVVAVRQQAKQGRLLREGMKVVIAGRPNAGKSSLLNALAEEEVAIVTDIAGTTRDVLREYIHIDGMPLHIIDTAGLRETDNEVERIGIERTWKEINQADHLLFMVDTTVIDSDDYKGLWSDFTDRFPQRLPITIVRNKVDMTDEPIQQTAVDQYTVISLSAKNRTGVDLLKQHLKKSIGFDNNMLEGGFIARSRHLNALDIAYHHLLLGMEQLTVFHAGELLAEELRLAQNALNEITGEFSSDDLLGKIFSSFCIGK